MKSLLTGLLVLVVSGSFAQNCKDYFLLQNNKTVEMSIYNKKGKLSGKQVYSVSNVSNSGNVTTADISTTMMDDKDKTIATGKNSIKCNGGVMMMSMKMMMPQQQQEQQPVTAADVTAESNFLEYPVNMNVGDDLKAGDFSMDINTSGMKSQVTMVINDRKVEGKEKITTPAGSWDCFKITYNGKMTIKMGISIPRKMSGTEWFAPGFGVVKTQTSDGGTELTAIK
jgi:hypothetical protein